MGNLEDKDVYPGASGGAQSTHTGRLTGIFWVKQGSVFGLSPMSILLGVAGLRWRVRTHS
jgi:hypothetical protein